MLRIPLGLRNPDGQPAFRHGIRNITDTADPAVAFRNALLTQQDKQSIVVLAGPATNLARTLALPGAKNIVAAKVRLLVMAAGEFGGGGPDPRIRADVSSASKLFAEWPSPIVAVGVEAGNAVPYPDRSIDNDFSWTPNHPVAAAYRAYRETHRGAEAAPAQAVLAALYAANPNADYWKLSPMGVIEADDDGRTRLRESAVGSHRYVIVDAAQKKTVTQAFIALAAARPGAGRGVPPATK
jgi:inosine-uridine nucleoside N-ribohydrolase